jgi:hypothetical protein
MAYNKRPDLGQANMANSEPVVIASDQSAVPVDLGANNDVTVTSGSITANAGTNLNTSALALETGGNLASIKTNTDKIPALGQALAAASVPVVLTDAQQTALTPPAAITGFATSAKQDTIIGHVDGIEGLLTTIDADTGNLPTIETNTDFGTVTGGGTETGALRVTIANNSTGVVSVDDNGGSLTVDGTVAATQSGTWNVGTVTAVTGITNALPAGTNNIGDVDVLTLPSLPAGTNNIGDVDVLSVTPGTGATNLGKAEDAAHASGDVGVMALTVRTNTAASRAGTDGDYQPLITDTNGRLHIINSVNETTTKEVVGDVAADAAVAGNPVLQGLRASTATPSAMSADGDAVYAWGTRNGATVVAGELVDDAAFGVATSRVFANGLLADEASTDSVDEGDIGVARMTLDRKAIVTPLAHTAGGATPYKLVSAASTNATSLKNGAGQIYSIVAMNINAAVRYLKLYNKASAPTVGTDTPVQVYAIPGATTGGGFSINIPVGMEFTTGISFALTTGITDADTGAVAASEILVNIIYK